VSSSAHQESIPGGRTAAGDGPREDLGLLAAVHQVEAEEHAAAPAAGPVANLVTAVVITALGVAGVIGSLALGVGAPATPGPGTWPLLVSGVLVVLGLVLGALTRRTTDAERFTRSALLVLIGVISMIAFVALIGVIGFEIPTALLAFVWLRFLGHEGWRTCVIASLGIVVAFYLLFVAALAVPIPHLF
jgi:hypothetical protein